MNASEIMLECPVVLDPDMVIPQAFERARESTLDILPVVDAGGYYHGAVPKVTLVENYNQQEKRVMDLCCTDAIVCAPNFALEHLKQDADSAIPHKTIVVVDDAGHFRGIVPEVHWAVDEAKTQSGQPRNRLEVRTVSMHLTWRCVDCGELMNRNEGLPQKCPHCGAGPDSMALYTED